MAMFSKKSTNLPARRRPQAVTDGVQSASLGDHNSFRRNRTLTGSASPQVSSTNESRSQLKSPRTQTHELVRQRRHIGTILLFVLASAALLFGLISQFSAGVVVKAEDVSLQLDPVYEKTIQDYLSQRPIERLRFLLDVNALGNYMQAVTPEVAAVKIDGAAGFGKSAFIVTMRTPIAGWTINGHQQYVDGSGTAFTRNYFASPKLQIVDNSGVQVAAGQAIASNSFLGFIGRVVNRAQAGGYVVQQVIIPAGTSRQVELHLAGVLYPIKFSVDRATGEQVEDMITSVKWLAAHSVTPQYLDVRVSGKAYYR